MCPESIQPRVMKNTGIYWRYKKHCTQDSDTSVTFKAGTLGPHTVFPAEVPCSFCSGSRSHGTNFATTRFMPRSCVKISDTVVFGIPRSASSSRCQSLIFVDCSPRMVNILRCSACGRTWITFNRFLTIFEAFVPHFCLCCTHCIILKSLLNYQIVPSEKCSSLRQNLMQIGCSTCPVILNATAHSPQAHSTASTALH